MAAVRKSGVAAAHAAIRELFSPDEIRHKLFDDLRAHAGSLHMCVEHAAAAVQNSWEESGAPSVGDVDRVLMEFDEKSKEARHAICRLRILVTAHHLPSSIPSRPRRGPLRRVPADHNQDDGPPF